MDDNEKIKNIIYLIEQSPLDPTVKGILIRDLQADGLTDFLKEQIKAYCLVGIQKADEQIEKAKKALESGQRQNPAN